MKKSFISLVVLADIFQVITCLGYGFRPFLRNTSLPERCQKPLENANIGPCCTIPDFFDEADLEKCGFRKSEKNNTPKPGGLLDCSRQLCVMKKYKLDNKDESVDQVALKAFLRAWVIKNSAFKPAMRKARKECLGIEHPEDSEICEADELFYCVVNILYIECPVWKNGEGCQEIKSYIDECLKH